MMIKMLRMEEPTMIQPMVVKAENADIWRKQSPNATAPVFPPAPMIPEMDPVILGLT